MIKNNTQKIKKEFTRQCAVCVGDILVKVFDEGKYSGGNFFCEVEDAAGYRDTGKTFNLGDGYIAHISEPVGKIEKWEYWECDRCYNS